jgi:CrcB protein
MQSSQLGQTLLVGLGGFVGSAARFLLIGGVQRLCGPCAFPLGTLVVNTLGCLLIGMLAGLPESRQLLGPSQRLLLTVGVLGGFTTFSTFAIETLELGRAADWARAALNVSSQVGLGLIAAWAGYRATISL